MAVISTVKTDCKDCYKCVRSCPMKAIQISEGRAKIVEERCINDGKCINVCPQEAKKVRETDLEQVRRWLDKGERIAVSLAPTYPVGLNLEGDCEIVPKLREIGFTYIQETAWAAEYVAKEHLQLLENKESLPIITSCCPAIVDLVEKHYPHLIKHLAPLLSPMALHGKVLKRDYEKVVFIGPCVAKKEEMEYDEVEGYIDAVLTFKELEDLIDEREGQIESIKQKFDGEEPTLARLFPLGGGLLKTANLSTDLLADKFLTITGLEETFEILEDFSRWEHLELIEMMACKGGCIGGVGSATSTPIIERRQKLLNLQREKNNKCKVSCMKVELERKFHPRKGNYEIPLEKDIRHILLKIGKSSPEDELNCGSCGYNSCREKAIAVYNGLAEVEMCLPYMRSRAESMSNLIIQSVPSGIIGTNSQFEIKEVNSAAEKMFQINRQRVVEKQLSTIMDDSLFKQVAKNQKMATDLVKFSESLIVRRSVYYVDEHDLIIGIFYDVTQQEKQKEELDEMREETFDKAQEVIDKQMRVAQEIAGLLGETTAETKVTLTNLMDLMRKK